MAASLRSVLFAYICLVFQVTHRICMMQCNPMPGPGMYPGDVGDLRFSGSHVESGTASQRREGLNTRKIRFDPSFLDFNEQPVGMPRIKTVTILNPNTEQSLHLQSISGSTVHFHASFFQAKIVQPLGNTTFEIVFLARLVGNVENTLFIHTSKGVYPYQVFGVGIPNPYRLRPFLGARVPVNFSFTSLINMHNPFNSPLQVIEMYSSGGDLHLELPSGLEEAPQKHWEIPPYETKALMRVSFEGRSANNHTAFIRIKTSNATPATEFLILPVEVEVTAVPGLFPSVDLLDFGTLRTMDEPKAVGVYLLNSGPKQVHISSITVEPSNSAVSVTFTPLNLKPGTKYIKVATITFSAYNVKRNRQSSGKLIIKTNSKTTPKLELPFQANVLQGTIAYSVSKTRFFVGKPPFVPVIRGLPITNTFAFTMVIYEAAFPPEVESLFSVINFTKPAMISPQKTVTPFYVQFLANGSDTSFSTILRVYTNASIFTIPIHCYDGKVKYAVDGLEVDVVDYGTVGTGQNRTKSLKIYNSNPVEVTITKITCNVDFASIKLLDVRLNGSKINSNSNNNTSSSKTIAFGNNEHGKVSVKPNHVALFNVQLTVPMKDGLYSGEFEMTTNFEVLHVPIYFKAMDGKILPSPPVITFEPCFPGRVESQSLSLTSTFSHPLKLLSVVPHPADTRFTFLSNTTDSSTSTARKLYRVGSIQFDPSKSCKSQCYVGLGTGTLGSKWLNALTLPSDVVDIDTQYVDKLQRLYDSLKRTGKTKINATFNINTDLAQGISLTALASLTWPTLAPDKPIKFPLTHIGNYSLKHFSLENPADVPVVVQIVSLSRYPKSQGLLDVIADRFDADAYSLDHSDSVFSLPNVDSQKNNSTSKSSIGVTPAISGVLGVTPASTTHVALLSPRSKIQIPVTFLPVDDRIRSSIILIRNNLTVLDAVTAQGQGARGEFMLNSKKPGLHSTLLFELRASHLSECHRTSPRSRAQPPLSVKKVLTATNPGQLAIFVSSLSIDGYECEGYGFKILNCKSFILNPNSSRKIEIAFTPDFTMSRVTRHLEVRTTFGPVMEFTLVATIPPHLLPLCASAIGLTTWEPYLQIVTVVVMFVMFIWVVGSAYSEARKISGDPLPDTTSLLLMSYEERDQVFDLNAIARDKPKSHKDDRQNIFRKRRAVKDSKTDERPSSGQTTAATTPTTSNSTNNNINKTTRHDNTRNRSPKLDTTKTSNDSISRDGNRAACDSYETSRKFSPSPHQENKIRSAQDKVSRNGSDSHSSLSKRPSEYNRVFERDYKTHVAQIEELKQSIASVQEMETENSLYFVDSCKKDFKDVKSKSKKKSKALSKREEKDSKLLKNKERAMTRQSGEDEGGCSDDSGSEPTIEKMTLDIRMDQTNENRQPRLVSLPNDSSSSTQKESTNRGNSTQDNKTRARKNQVVPTGNDVTSKGKKHDNQAGGKSKGQDSSFKSKDRVSALQLESRDLGPTSPHAIAAAVMSQLEKSLQTFSNDNSYEEDEGKKRAFTKALGSSNHLTDSPPPISPTNLSGSSRSSSYSSIVSDGSSSGSDQGKASIAKALKQRLKPSRSMPLGDQSQLYDGCHLERQAQPIGFRKVKSSNPFTLSATKNSPWSTSAESALAPGSPSPSLQRASMSKFNPIPSSSLFESTPFNRTSNVADDLSSPQGSQDGQCLPHDFSVFGVSDTSEDTRNRPSVWSTKPNSKHFGNPQSLFSSGPPDDAYQGKTVRRPNNWVNFLDNAKTSPTTLNFKSMAEIWDSGSIPATDGWSHCGPTPYRPGNRATPVENEADPVDAMFSTVPSWVSSADTQESTTFIAQETWGPAQVSSIWREQYGTVSSSTAVPVTSDSLAYQPLSSQQGVVADPTEPESPGGTFDAMNGFSSADIWKQQPWSSGKDGELY